MNEGDCLSYHLLLKLQSLLCLITLHFCYCPVCLLEGNGYGLALELVMALSAGSVTILMYPRIEPSIDSQECLFIYVFYYVKSMQNY